MPRAFHVVLLLALVAPALAGCLAPDAPPAPATVTSAGSAPIYDRVIAEHAPIAASDGTLLDAWVFRPDTSATGERVPVIINYSPYWSNAAPPAETGGDAFSLYLLDYYVPRGYAVALVSARGTGASEGCFTIGGPLELDDVDVVASALATSEWSNGNVAASGKSYDGTMAQGLLTRSNPHVRTIVPVSPISELYKYNYYEGVPYLVTGQAFNTYYPVTTGVAQSSDLQGTAPALATRFCDESAAVQASQYESAATGVYSPYWQARNYTALLPDRVDASVFYIHGLADWNVKPDHMVPWIDALRERDVTVKMWLGQWEHDYPRRADWNATMLRWFDHYLKGMDTGILAEPLVQVQDSDGVWRDENEWPARRAVATRFHPDAGGALGPEPGSGESSYQDRPSLPGAPLGEVRFASEPLPRAMRLVGAPVLSAAVSATGPRATVSVTLLVDGKVVDQGFLDLAHRGDPAALTPMVPGVVEVVRVPLYPQDVLVPAGSVVSLVVSHDGAQAPVTVLPFPTGAVVTLHHGADTFLDLPLVAAEDVTLEAVQPEDVGCWAC